MKFCCRRWKSLMLLMVWAWFLKKSDLLSWWLLSVLAHRHHESGIANLKTAPTNSWIPIILFLLKSNSSKMPWIFISFLFSEAPDVFPCLPLGCDGSPDPLLLFDSFLVPSTSKDDSLHPAPSAIGQLDPQLLVEVESELGLVQVYDLDSHKEYFQKTFQKLDHS